MYKSIVRALAAFCLLLSIGGVHAATVRVQEECGFGLDPCGAGVFTLTTGEEPIGYYDSELGHVFELSFTGDTLVMTALHNNFVFESQPFGLDVYLPTGPMVPPDDYCVENCPVPTSIGFLPMSSFPSLAGQQVTVRLLVPEPASLGLMLAGLLLIGWRLRSRRSLQHV